RVLTGEVIATLALYDTATKPAQWVAGGSVADAVLARRGENVLLVNLPKDQRRGEPNLAFTPLAEIDLSDTLSEVIGTGPGAVAAFAAAVEEWKLLIAAGLAGVAREALRLAAAYACERHQFGQPIGAYQGISHPLADLLCDADGGKFLVWKAIR